VTIVLGFDTATPATAVALRTADGRVLQARDDPGAGEHPGHATRLLGMARDLLAEAGVAWEALARVAVGVGPGTFTGLRVGVATARGLAQSLPAELVGVSSLQALAAAADGSRLLDASEAPAILAVIDARRGQAFAAAYELDRAGGAPRALTTPRALAPEELGGVVAQVESADGRTRRWLAVGDGAVRFAEVLAVAGIPSPPESSRMHRVSAAAICELGAHAQAAARLEQVLPDYRRRPDAELALAAAASAEAATRR
jgi:tRNA threonylcarbamoyladenosine biosynthesis protein TsaB